MFRTSEACITAKGKSRDRERLPVPSREGLSRGSLASASWRMITAGFRLGDQTSNAPRADPPVSLRPLSSACIRLRSTWRGRRPDTRADGPQSPRSQSTLSRPCSGMGSTHPRLSCSSSGRRPSDSIPTATGRSVPATTDRRGSAWKCVSWLRSVLTHRGCVHRRSPVVLRQARCREPGCGDRRTVRAVGRRERNRSRFIARASIGPRAAEARRLRAAT